MPGLHKFCLVLLLAWFPVATSGAELEVIRLGEQPLYLPSGLIFAAVQADPVLQQALSRAEVSLQWRPFLSGEPLTQAYAAGEIRGGVAGDMPMLRLAADHSLAIPLTLQQGFTSIITNRPMRLQDLKGKRIGIIWGSNAHYTALSALEEAGLSDQEVSLIPLELDQLVAAYQAGKIDGFSAWEPTLSVIAQGDKPTFTLYRKLSSGYLFLDPQLFEQHPRATQALVAAFVRAIKELESDRDHLRRASELARAHAVELYGEKVVQLSLRQITHLAQADLLMFRTGGRIPAQLIEPGGALEVEFRRLQKRGLIPPAARWEKVRSYFGSLPSSQVE